MVRKKRSLINWIVFLVLVFIIVGGTTYYMYFFKPKNSIELYQQLTFAESFDEAQKMMLDGYEGNIKEEDFDYIQANIAEHIGQFTLFEYDNKSYVMMTSPGEERLKVLAIEELPTDVREFFSELMR